MKNRQTSHVSNGPTTRSGALTRRGLMGALGASAVGAGILGTTSSPLKAQAGQQPVNGPIIDAHIHIWKLPRSLPPMSDFGSYPGDPTDGFCCSVSSADPTGAVPWLQVDCLIPNYIANWGGRRVNQVVVIESSVAVPPADIIQSNLWMLQQAANDTNGPDGGSKILAVSGCVDATQSPTTFAAQITMLAKNPQFVGIRLGDLGSIFMPNATSSYANLLPNVVPNLKMMASMELQADFNMGPPGGAILAQIGQATVTSTSPGLSIVMDHFAGEGNTFAPSDAWYADMQAAAGYPGLHVKVSDTEVLSEAAVGGYTSVGIRKCSTKIPSQDNIE